MAQKGTTLQELLAREVFRKLHDGVHYAYASAVPGDVAEFGTGWGRSAFVIAAAMREYAELYQRHQGRHGIGPRSLHLFDSFRGLPESRSEVDRASPHVASGFWSEEACKGMSEAEVARICGQFVDPARVRVYAGWFEDTLPRIPTGAKFALVHVDCDLYESARQVLDHLFANDHFADGCALYFDDWNCNRASPEMGERRAWRECVERYAPHFTDWGGYGPFGWRFILHK